MTEVLVAAMTYNALVEAGREARHQADNVQWTEGDLALQVDALPAGERPRDPATGLFIVDETKALRRYAEDIGISYSTIRVYRATADAWPSVLRRTEVSWHVHKTLAAQDDRFDLIQPGMTVRQAEDIVRKRNTGGRGKPSWFELLGVVGDTLLKGHKQLDKFEIEVSKSEKKPSADLGRKAEQYAIWAEDLAKRLRGREGGPFA